MEQGFLNPQQVLSQLGLEKNMVAVDFGSGSGGWAIPLARILKDGQVYAVDVLDEAISALGSRVKIEKILNIKIIKADVEKDTTIPSESCDLVLMTNLLFECENRKGAIEEGKRVLKSGGKILIVDWKKDAPLGPKEGRVPPEEIKKIAAESDFKFDKEFDAGIYHFGLILVK